MPPGTAGRKEAPRDFRGDFRHFSSFFLVLLDEGINIASASPAVSAGDPTVRMSWPVLRPIVRYTGPLGSPRRCAPRR